jgi:hypothetical protein
MQADLWSTVQGDQPCRLVKYAGWTGQPSRLVNIMQANLLSKLINQAVSLPYSLVDQAGWLT